MADFKSALSPIYKVISALVLILALSSLYASAYVQIDIGQATISGVMSGTSGLEKRGAGSVILSAINTYTGTTIVSAGELLINGTNSGLGEVTVGEHGTLGGTGTIGGNVVNTAGGLVRASGGADHTPGHYLSIGGDYTQAGGESTFLANVSPLAFDYLAVTGAANIAGKLNVYVQPGFYDSTDGVAYHILQATGGITGLFESLTNLGAVANLTGALSLGEYYILTVRGVAREFTAERVTADEIASVTGRITFDADTITILDDDIAIPNPVTFSAGAIEIADGHTMTFTGPLLSTADTTTTFDGGGTIVFDTTADGTQLLGDTAVGNNTTLVVNTAIAGPVIIDNGGTLRGVGPFQSVANTSGTLWGGNFVPIHDNLTLGDAATTVVEFKPVIGGLNATKYELGRTATLAGNLRLIPEVGGAYPIIFAGNTDYEYMIVTAANAIEGEFATLEAPDIAGFEYTLSQTAESLLVKLHVSERTELDTKDTIGGIRFDYFIIPAPYPHNLEKIAQSIAARSSNRASAKSAHKQAGSSTKKAAKKSKKGSSEEGNNDGNEGGDGNFRNLMPTFRAGFIPQMGGDLTTQRTDQLIAALAEYGAIDAKSSDKRHTVWIEPFTQNARNKEFKTSPHTKDSAQGVIAGYHYLTVNKHVLGITAMALFNKNLQPSDKRNKSNDRTFAFGPYFSFEAYKDWQYDGNALVMFSQSKQAQHKTDGVSEGIVIGRPNSTTYMTSHTLHRLFSIKKTFELDIFAGVDYSYSDRKKYTEEGDQSLVLVNEKFERKDWDGHIGAEITQTWTNADKSKIEVSLQGAMTYDITYKQKRIERSNGVGSQAASVSNGIPSAGQGRVLLECEVSVGYTNPNDSCNFLLTGTLQHQSHRISQTGMLKLVCKF